MGDPDRHPGIIVAALGERADLLRLVGDDLAAQADIDRITRLEGGRAGQPSIDPTRDHARDEGPPVAADDPAMVGAREWARRRLNGMGTPGHLRRPAPPAVRGRRRGDAVGRAVRHG